MIALPHHLALSLRAGFPDRSGARQREAESTTFPGLETRPELKGGGLALIEEAGDRMGLRA
eukprot:CAMPEP_0184329380 /NCGR_PEP_ID=MMETSP1049-20130417/144120_1 /TAXON_ID=77928 /ORGANISM="Proteomonas sulcata, Strain CCMP704" /LENGTH=60 /DNA_ID=CAMNT_0026651747 /DNA_START=1426 /DNA_END=1608 /DNA_ORIENTATION=-